MRLWYSMWDSNPHLTELKSVASSSWANRAYWRQEWDSNPRVNISIDTEVFKTTRLWPDLRTLPYCQFNGLSDLPWWIQKESNLRRVGLQPTVLPTELWIQMVGASGLEPASDDYKSSALTDWAMPQYWGEELPPLLFTRQRPHPHTW